MRILIVGLNYAPEPVGIGPYTAGTARALAAAGHEVEVVTAKPYYPGWTHAPGFGHRRYARTREDGVRITRCPLYVPRRPNGVRRLVHHLSFALAALPPTLAAALRRRPQLVLTVAPSLLSVPLVRLAARLAGARSWLHIQDFEVGAALATGLLDARSPVGRAAARFEAIALAGFDRYSSISPQMCALLRAKGVAAERIVEFRNWAEIDAIVPLDRASAYVRQWGIATPHVALYSGNIANKQGVGIIVAAAKLLRERRDLTFVICGEGATRDALVASAAELPNIRFFPLQPRESLEELLGLATVHLLPQLDGAADLVLPSKLANMLASGRPVVATALPGTGLAAEIAGCGVATPPGDATAFAAAIAGLLDEPDRRARIGVTARARAVEHWSRAKILAALVTRATELGASSAAAPSSPAALSIHPAASPP